MFWSDLLRAIKASGLKASTQRKHLSYVRAFFEYVQLETWDFSKQEIHPDYVAADRLASYITATDRNLEYAIHLTCIMKRYFTPPLPLDEYDAMLGRFASDRAIVREEMRGKYTEEEEEAVSDEKTTTVVSPHPNA